MLKLKKEKIGILGYGEIGKAIARFYRNPLIKDLNRDDGLIGVEILHVCIPWSKYFYELLEKEIKYINPKLVIIHSTVAPGTTKKLSDRFNGIVVHSPVRGKHPYLYESIKTFIKYVGYDKKETGLMAAKHLSKIGIRTKLFSSSITTELGKLLDTTYYGICIAWHGEMKKMCDKMEVDFEAAVTEFNKTYNDGYKRMGDPQFIRPILAPPAGKIGGHCVIPNAEIIRDDIKSEAIDFLLKYK